MRLSVALGCLLLAGCTGPHSTGALWAQRDIEQETALFRLSDAQRAEQVRAVELGVADETLAAERARIESGLSDCPGPGGARQLVAPSVGDRPRDTVRIQAQDDPGRLATLAQIALADWRLRRARATGDAQFCDAARQALAGIVAGLSGESAARSSASGESAARGPASGESAARGSASGESAARGSASGGAVSDPLSATGTATVSRDPGHVVPAAIAPTVNEALSSYALGYIDTVSAQTPLPQYLAAVYGGVLLAPVTIPVLNGDTPESLVDRFAPAYPDWEPDALYAVLITK